METKDLFSSGSLPVPDPLENKDEDSARKSRPWLEVSEPDFDIHSLPCRPILSVETTGRKDEVLTVIEKLPQSEPFLRTLIKRFTGDCRLKGSYRMDRKDGVIEILGDKRIAIREFFDQEGIPYLG